MNLTDHDRDEAFVSYLAAEDHADLIAVNIGDPAHSPTRRARALYDLAVQIAIQAEIHDAAFGPRTTDDGQNRDMAEALTFEAELVSAIAATEHALATRNPRVPAAAVLEQAAGPILDSLAAVADRVMRSDLLAELHEAAAPVIGGHAADAAATLSYLYAPHQGRTAQAA